MKSMPARAAVLVFAAPLALAGCTEAVEGTVDTEDGTETNATSSTPTSSSTATSGSTSSPVTSSSTSTPTTSSTDTSDETDSTPSSDDSTTTNPVETEGSGSTLGSGSTGSTSGSSSGSESGSTTTGGGPICGDGVTNGDDECDDMNTDSADGCLANCRFPTSCANILDEDPAATDGTYALNPGGSGEFLAYCDMSTDGGGWTLISRYANADNVDNWMADDGGWWFDVETEQGNPLSTSQLVDMIGAGFWRVPGAEMKITRSDNPDNSFLLRTTGDCLGADTFRGFITSLGFDNLGGSWAVDEVLHTCDAMLGNNYAETQGFAQAECDGEIGAPNSISFWANWRNPDNLVAADSSVMMIGGGGNDCNRSDHGLGITEDNTGSFAVPGESEGTFEADFANDGFGTPTNLYALNVFVR